MIVPGYHREYVLDASVAAKWFVGNGKVDRERAVALRDRHVAGDCRLVLPEFALLEIVNAIRYSRRAEEPDGATAVEVLWDLDLEIHRVSEDLLRKANAIAWAYKVTLYDAAYVALAESLGYPLLTADQTLLKKMKGHSIVLALDQLEAA